MLQTEPRRASRWIFGQSGTVQVWEVSGDDRVWASVFVGYGGPIVLLNDRVAQTDYEHGALDWALSLVARGDPGLFVLVVE